MGDTAEEKFSKNAALAFSFRTSSSFSSK